MDTTPHTLTTLFEQLGLPADARAIESFVAEHRPLAADVALADAPWWNEAQAGFLREAVDDDADWAERVDELDALLRHTEAEAAQEDRR